jgi:hypothetical protein
MKPTWQRSSNSRFGKIERRRFRPGKKRRV